MSLLLAVVFVWALIDRWALRWLAWLWLILVSLPFLAIVLALAVVLLVGTAVAMFTRRGRRPATDAHLAKEA